MKFTPGKVIYIIISIGLFFVLLGAVAVNLIDRKLKDFDSQTLNRTGREKYFLVNKELESIERSLHFLSGLVLNDKTLIKQFIQNDEVYGFIAAGFYSEGNETHYLINPLYLQTDSLRKYKKQLERPDFFSPNTYKVMGGELFTIWRFNKEGKTVDFLINLNKLNSRFWNMSLGSFAYAEVYDKDGILIIGPDPAKLGRVNKISDTDAILTSDYINLEVLRQSFQIKGFLKNHKMVVYVPLPMKADVAAEIGSLIWLLWLLGMLTVSVFLFYIIKQDRKQYSLQMKNISYQNEKSISELSNLKEKINPHFLFNTLGTLQHLVTKDPLLAKKFVAKLAKVYRTLLNVPNTGVSALKDELYFLNEYLFLQHLRFGEALRPIKLEVKENFNSFYIPTLSLQILVENAIKHNEITLENPLTIEIFTNEDGVIIRNSKRLRNGNVESEGYGSKIIDQTYQHYKVKGYEIEESETHYIVFLPFINNS